MLPLVGFDAIFMRTEPPLDPLMKLEGDPYSELLTLSDERF